MVVLPLKRGGGGGGSCCWCLLAVTSHVHSGVWWTLSPPWGLQGLLAFDLLPRLSITHHSAGLRPRRAAGRGWCANTSSDVPERDPLSNSDIIQQITQTRRGMCTESAYLWMFRARIKICQRKVVTLIGGWNEVAVHMEGFKALKLLSILLSYLSLSRSLPAEFS